MTCVVKRAKARREAFHRQFADRRRAVIAFHARDFDERVTRLPKRLIGKLFVLAFDFLQAEHIWLLFIQKPNDLVNAKANGIDIPRSDFNIHRRGLARLM
jgi:hypothetical protein